MTAAELPLGRDVAYPTHYDPALLFPIARSLGRSALGLGDALLPFVGVDRWHAYELSWLDARGKPRVATATFTVPFDSPNLIESKSLKLYLNSFNAHRVANELALRDLVVADLSRAAGAPVRFDFGLPPIDTDTGDAWSIDALELDIYRYGPPDPQRRPEAKHQRQPQIGGSRQQREPAGPARHEAARRKKHEEERCQQHG